MEFIEAVVRPLLEEVCSASGRACARLTSQQHAMTLRSCCKAGCVFCAPVIHPFKFTFVVIFFLLLLLYLLVTTLANGFGMLLMYLIMPTIVRLCSAIFLPSQAPIATPRSMSISKATCSEL